MDELTKYTFFFCTSILAVELISSLMPGKADSFVRGTAVLLLSGIFILSILRIDFDFYMPNLSAESETETGDYRQNAVECGVRLLQERIYLILNASGISVPDKEEGISVLYRLNDKGELDIDRIHVILEYQTDNERALAVLQGILTPAIPVEVYVK